MVVLQTGMLHLGPSIIIIFLLTCGDSTDIFNKNIHTMNRNASQGETVVFYCNESEDEEDKGADVGWRKEEILLFIYSPYYNQTVRNYTSSRMYVDPNNPRKLQISDVQPSDTGTYRCFPSEVQEQWKLIIEVTESEPEPHRKMFLYIIPSVTGAAAVCFVIICAAWIHRKQKTRNKEIGHELQTQGRRPDRVWNLTASGMNPINLARARGHRSAWSGVEINLQDFSCLFKIFDHDSEQVTCWSSGDGNRNHSFEVTIKMSLNRIKNIKTE
ncbi:hypothetical protein SRHO_G00105950 [Serrasalmus rhombeus]